MKTSLLASLKNSAAYRWVVRYRLYHIPFWIGYQLFWAALFSGQNLLSWGTAITVAIPSVAQASGAYLNIYYWVPRYLKRGHYLRYVAGFVGCVLLSAGLLILAYRLMFFLANGQWTGVAEVWFGGHTVFVGSTIAMAFTAVVLVMMIKSVKDWLRDQHHTKQLEKEKLETELKFLRSQFNPHFLFNTINSINFLIQKDPRRASDTLAKFSDLLRYQLYECNEARIPLKKEVHYLSNFIALEKLRVNDNVAVSLDVSEDVNGAQIAPFVLMPFVENAFKHVSKGRQRDNFIRISLRQDDRQLRFGVENSREAKPASTREAIHYGGIGLANVRRRLALLYPQQHTLDVGEPGDTYSIHLTLDLHEDQLLSY